MQSKITPTAYEIMVSEVYQALIKLDGINIDNLKNIQVHHDVKIKGKSGATHQIDVYWEFSVAGVIHKTCIECKNWNSNVTKGDIAKFSAIIEDIGSKGLFVTTKGFQDGAKKFGKYNDIRLLTINNIENHGYIARIGRPIYKNLTIDFSEEVQVDFLSNIEDNTSIYDNNRKIVCNFNELLQQPYDDGHYANNISGKYFLIDDKLIEILKIEYDFECNTFLELKDMNYYAKALIYDINSNNEFYFNFDQTIIPR